MKKYKYTNKEERPIPKYKNGDIAWYIDSWFEHPQRCIIKGCCNVSWFEGNELNPSGWWIDYKYKPDYCERTKQHTIREESLFDTEQEALIALFEQFKEKLKRKVEFFNKESKKLGIKQELRLILKRRVGEVILPLSLLNTNLLIAYPISHSRHYGNFGK